MSLSNGVEVPEAARRDFPDDPFAARRAKLEEWRALGIDPYPAHTPEHSTIAVARSTGNHLLGEGRYESGVGVAGRIRSLRLQGALCFVDLEDGTGKIQLLIKKDLVSAELFAQLELLDVGDFVWADGPLFVTRRGELTVEVVQWQLMGKSLHPLADSWHGLQDQEIRQRQRYADLLANPHVRERFIKRSNFIWNLRQFLVAEGFMEVETPILEHTPGGADAEPFTTHYNALDTDFYLRIAPELHLKRLVVGGYDKVFEIGKSFRNEGMSPWHLQELTTLETYWAYADYGQMMELAERMYRTVIINTFNTLQFERGDITLDFAVVWPRTTYADLLKEYAGVDILTISDEDLRAAVRSHGIDVQDAIGRGRLMDLLYKKTARPHLIQPQFIVDIPVEFSPLAKKKASDPRLTERFFILIDGSEISNAFSELNDPDDQLKRFEEQENLRAAGDAEAQRLDHDFVRALQYGLPPTVGYAIGIDRLLVILLGLDTVREAVLFPTMRPEPTDKYSS